MRFPVVIHSRHCIYYLLNYLASVIVRNTDMHSCSALYHQHIKSHMQVWQSDTMTFATKINVLYVEAGGVYTSYKPLPHRSSTIWDAVWANMLLAHTACKCASVPPFCLMCVWWEGKNVCQSPDQGRPTVIVSLHAQTCCPRHDSSSFWCHS